MPANSRSSRKFKRELRKKGYLLEREYFCTICKKEIDTLNHYQHHKEILMEIRREIK
ncbi:hypothetical protein ACNF41_07405 [Cuniculiplasmataceae archaeon SKW1]